MRMIAARPIPPHSCAAVFFLNVISTIFYEYMKPTLLNPKMVYSAYFKARVQQGEHGALGATDPLPVQPDRVPSMEEVWLDATLGPDGKAGEREQPAKAKQRRSQGPKGKREGAEQVGSPGQREAKPSHARPATRSQATRSQATLGAKAGKSKGEGKADISGATKRSDAEQAKAKAKRTKRRRRSEGGAAERGAENRLLLDRARQRSPA